MITERRNVACRLIMKAISKGSLAGCLIHLDGGRTNLAIGPNKTLRFLSMQTVGHSPTGFKSQSLMLTYLPEIDPPLVAVMPSLSLPCLLKNSNRLPLLICTRYHAQDNLEEMYAELTSSMSPRGKYTL